MTAARRDEPWFFRRGVLVGWLGFEPVTNVLGAVVWPGLFWLTTAGLGFALVAGSRGEP